MAKLPQLSDFLFSGLVSVGSLMATATVAQASEFKWYPVTYGNNPDAHVANFLPGHGAPKGLVIWAPPSGWHQSAATTNTAAFESLVTQGISILSINYSTGYEAAYPNPVIDIKSITAAAVAGYCEDCTPQGMWKVIKESAKKGVMLLGEEAGGTLTMTAAGELITYSETTRLKCVGAINSPMDFRQIAYYPDEGRNAINRYAGIIGTSYSNNYRYSEISPAVKVYSGQWLNLTDIRWYFHFKEKDSLFPYEFSKDMPRYLSELGAPVYQSMTRSKAGSNSFDAPDRHAVINTQVEHCFRLSN